MVLDLMRRVNLRHIAIAAFLPLVLAQTCVPSDHPLASDSGTIEFAETQSASGIRVEDVPSGSAAPHLPFELTVDVSSDQPLVPEDVEVTVTFVCAFGNSDSFTVSLAETGISGQALEGTFSRTANVEAGECVNQQGQREQVTWTVSFVRPSATTQQLTFDYTMSWRSASVAN